ncbi:MAG: HEAT repeat domain-containing protein [Planctomycetes bacterium]|nr:HEAT repeat domain-containing protein [Planctomycetota bacterium]
MSDPTPERDALEARTDLLARLSPRLNETTRAWLEAQGALPLSELREVLPRTARTLGTKGLIAAFAERAGASVEAVWGAVPIGAWTLSDAGSVLLVAQAVEREQDPYAALFATYDAGGTEVKVACLRALNFVGPCAIGPGLELIADAGRTYLPELLGAAWAGNPFSARFLSDHDYRKAVLKAFFCEVPVEGFLRLEERADAELAKSLCDYVDERLAAGRTIPRPIWPLAALHPRPGLVGRLIGMLEHPDAEERITAARALANAQDARALSFVRERRSRESEPTVQAVLEVALETLSQLPQSEVSA